MYSLFQVNDTVSPLHTNVYQCRRRKRLWFDPWVRKIPWRRAWQVIFSCICFLWHTEKRITWGTWIWTLWQENRWSRESGWTPPRDFNRMQPQKGLNLCLLRLLHWRWILYCWATGESPISPYHPQIFYFLSSSWKYLIFYLYCSTSVQFTTSSFLTS